MELNTSLIILVVLIAPPLFLLGRKVLNRLFFDEADALFGKRGKLKDAPDRHNDESSDNSSVYDGMITIELPVSDSPLAGDDNIVEPGPTS